jgi:hypothetical protein
MIEVKANARLGEPMAMFVVANNKPGRGEWYIECVANRGFDDARTDLGTVAYSYRLQHFTAISR